MDILKKVFRAVVLKGTRADVDRHVSLKSTIQSHKGYFEEFFDSKIISKVTCTYEGLCSVHFCDGRICTFETVADGYNRQYGIPASLDGKVLFVGSWEKGLFAYDIETGKEIWRFESTRITSIYVSETHVVAIRYGEAILKLDIANGTKIGELRSGTIEDTFELDPLHILVDTYRGKLSIVDTDALAVVKQYPDPLINPTKAISFMIREASLERNKLTISGLENSRPFCRVIDYNFLPIE